MKPHRLQSDEFPFSLKAIRERALQDCRLVCLLSSGLTLVEHHLWHYFPNHFQNHFLHSRRRKCTLPPLCFYRDFRDSELVPLKFRHNFWLPCCSDLYWSTILISILLNIAQYTESEQYWANSFNSSNVSFKGKLDQTVQVVTITYLKLVPNELLKAKEFENFRKQNLISS